MEISYKSSRSEVWGYYCYRWVHGDLKWIHLKIAILVFAGTFFLLTQHNHFSWNIILKSIGWAVVSIGWLPLVPLIMFKPQQRIIRINEDGLYTTIGKQSATIAWSKIASVNSVPPQIYIQGKNGNGFVVPQRAFTNELQRENFLRICSQFHNHNIA